MERDPSIKVVSAWNDNGYSLREGLRCAVMRGGHFMSLGWLTTRAVYSQVSAYDSADGLIGC